MTRRLGVALGGILAMALLGAAWLAGPGRRTSERGEPARTGVAPGPARSLLLAVLWGQSMRGRAGWTAVAGLVVVAAGLSPLHAGAAQKEPSVSSAWVRLPEPGATTAEAFAVVENPTMYDIYVVAASASGAARVEIRRTGKDGALKEATVPAYESLEMRPGGLYLSLLDLEAPLGEGDKVTLTLVTDGGLKLQVKATVKKR